MQNTWRQDRQPSRCILNRLYYLQSNNKRVFYKAPMYSPRPLFRLTFIKLSSQSLKINIYLIGDAGCNPTRSVQMTSGNGQYLTRCKAVATDVSINANWNVTVVGFGQAFHLDIQLSPPPPIYIVLFKHWNTGSSLSIAILWIHLFPFPKTGL